MLHMLGNMFGYSDLDAKSWKDVKHWRVELRPDNPRCLFVT